MSEQNVRKLQGVSETLLIPLYVRAMETERPGALIRDEKAATMMARIDYDFSRVKLHAHDEVGVVLRLREFDNHARQFMAGHPDPVVIHIGCGLDTRFERVDNGRVEWYDLDLPAVIELRRSLMEESGPRYHRLATSVFETAWLDEVSLHKPRPFLFLAEGVFPYCGEGQVRSLVLGLRDRFPGSELVFDAMTPFTIQMNNLQLSWSRLSARLHWGLKSARDLEGWGTGICLLEEWYYFDRPEPRLKGMQWVRRFPFLSKSTGIFHYRLG